MNEDLDSLEKQELEESHSGGSLLFRLWADARVLRKELQRQRRQLFSGDDAEDPDNEELLTVLEVAGGPVPDGAAAALPVPPPPAAEDVMPEDGNYLQTMRTWPRTTEPLPYVLLPTQDPLTGDDIPPPAPEVPEVPVSSGPVLYSSFMLDGAEPSVDNRTFLTRLQTEARKRISDYSAFTPGVGQLLLDAVCFVGLSSDNYSAFAFIFPPHNGGADITADGIRAALEKSGVKSDLKEDVIASVAAQQQYMLMFTAALGKPCINGRDGRVIDRFSRTKRIQLVEKEDRTVDYKDLNWLQRVNAGDVICELVSPTEPQDGCTVQGRVIAGRPGKKMIPPTGKNTVISEDGLSILAAMDGQITFTAQRFNVEQLLIIGTDLGSETGNLDVIGNIVIKGNVMEGFSVKATGDITISGMAEGAVVMAGGNILVGMGMNGNSHGMLLSKGNIISKYLENCTATAGGFIRSDNIINCTVCSDDGVFVTSGRGVIIGGSITALNAIEANAIGNRSNRATVLTLGSTPGFLSKKSDLEIAIKEINLLQVEHTKNLKYLAARKDLSAPQLQLAGDIKVKLAALKLKLTTLEKNYKEMVEKEIDMASCRISAKKLFPPTQITFGCTAVLVREQIETCTVYYHEGEIKFSTRL